MRKAVRKRVGLRGVVRLGESGSGDAKATEKPMCKESCKKKKLVREGRSDYGSLALEAPRPLRGQCVRKTVRKKGRLGQGGQIREIWPWTRQGH